MASRWKPGHGSGDPEMPACGEPKYGASPVLTALMFPRVYSVFFKRKNKYSGFTRKNEVIDIYHTLHMLYIDVYVHGEGDIYYRID